ncbi:MAG: 23S rRNA (guanosine(2251)-2'-O)-methyltransferase RlmB [Pseudomonadota bacterium]
MSKAQLIFGFHAVSSRLRHHPGSVRELYCDAARHDARMRDLIKLAEAKGVRVVPVDKVRLDGMAAGRHQGVAAKVEAVAMVASLDDVLDALSEVPLLLALDGVQDPHNLGACLRSADAFGAHAVIAPKDRAVALNATAARVACGAAETVPYLAVTNLARTLREIQERNIWVVGLAGEAEADLPAARLDGPLVLVLGAEGEGLRRLTRETCDELVRIPMLGTVDSVNVSVACGICLYEARRQRDVRWRSVVT